ncbi:TonB-dependent receptor [Niabella insulamsoli]|uniref:SusC/RagA family TonB-linked outer membrane protein n=1 Tax=Niabella insulamsoli TaxID=3144874 RepID=UPI0031FC1692
MFYKFIIKSIVFICILQISAAVTLFGQNPVTVTGTVTDPQSQPLAAVTVKVQGSDDAVLTNERGQYTIRVLPTAALEFNHVSFLPQTVEVGGKTLIDVQLQQKDNALDEVVVVGYGTVKKSDVTGSVISLKATDLSPGANVNVQQMLQGRASGVQITQSSGEPGSAMNIKVRGITSINAGNNPLYVIDGMPVNDGAPVGGSGAFAADANPRNPLNSLNPSDIASIEILKDASATAIYGSRGSNGVVMITTKSGSANRFSINLNSYYGFQEIARMEKDLTAQQYHDVINAIIADGGGLQSDTVSGDYGTGTDWQSQLYRPANVQSYDLSISGGARNTRYFISAGVFDQEGVMKNSGTTRYTARVNLENGVEKKYRIGINLSTSYIKDKFSSTGRGTNEDGAAIYAAINYDPTAPIFDANGNYNRSPFMNVDNPVALVNGETGIGNSYRTFGTLFGEYFIVPSLSAKLRLGGDINSTRRNDWIAPFTQSGRPYNGVASILTGTKSYYMGEGTLNYNYAKEDHRINAVAGATYEHFSTNSFSGNGRGFALPDLTYYAIGTGDPTQNVIGSGFDENVLISYLGRINYSFKDKYLLTASIRADGSGRFGANNKFGYFPSGAIAWKINEESFMSESDLFNELKLRLSYGVTGNQNIANYLFIPSFSVANNTVFGNNIYASIFPTRMENPDLQWEAAEQFDAGLDFSLLDRRLSGSIEYYRRRTTNLLVGLPLPASSGFTNQTRNIGSMRNTGVDIQLNASIIKTNNFSWDLNPNISFYKNVVLSIGSLGNIINSGLGINGGLAIIQPGSPIQSYYGYEIVGTWQTNDDFSVTKDNVQPGDVKYLDLNGDSTITDRDRKILGQPFPNYTFGISSLLRYKQLSLNFYIEGSQGASLLYNSMVDAYFPVSLRRNKLAEPYLNRWTPENPTNEYPSFVHPVAQGQRQVNSKTVMDASYIRLQSVRLSYDVPLPQDKRIRALSLFATGQNLAIITNYKGIDPSANAGAGDIMRLDFSSYPYTRTYTFGLNVEF